MRRRLTHTSYFTALLLILVLSFIHVPMATSQNSEEIIGKLRGLQEKVLALPLDEAFENIHAAGGQRKALANKIGAVIHQIEAGACEGAVNKLENDLKGKVKLWITSEYEAELIELIDEIISLIEGEAPPPPPEDTTPPNITTVLRVPETPNYDEDVTVVAQVEDEESGVDLVILSYSTSTVDWINITMNVEDSIYRAEIPAQPYNVNVSYNVYAYDSAGNSAVSDTYSYVVIDSQPPVISEVECSPISPNYTDTVSVTASVTEPKEASGVQLVILSYSDGGAWKNNTMTLKEETTYEGSIPPLPYGTTVEYLVYASDNAENWVFSSTYSYTVGAPAPIHDIAIVDIVSSPSTVKVGGTVAINVTVLNEGTVTESFNVSVYYNLALLEVRTLEDLDAGAEATPTFTWVTKSEGVYLIWAEAQPLLGETDVTDNIRSDGIVTVSSLQPPVALFTFSPAAPYTGQSATFDASSSYDPDGTIVSYAWSFGDSAVGDGEIVTHNYADNGTYAVKLAVVDNDGLTDIASGSVTVLNMPPVASFTESATSVSTGAVIHFNASNSHDPDGNIVDYFWDFGDDTTATGVFVNHFYADDGIYTVTLTVTDDDGATANATATKTILNRPPIPSFTESAETVYTGEIIYFDASDSYDPDGDIVGYFWDFGDGTDGTGVATEHAYADDGLYTVTLTVTDDDGATATATAAKAVSNRAPTASFTENATTAYRGEAIRFDASASFDPDGYITSYFWNFGDGTNATDVVVDHTYVNDGTYTVTLIITDDDDAIAIATATKIVLNHPPIASFIENATTVQTGVVIRFEASASYDPDGTIVNYYWNFGDGTNATNVIVDHSYTEDGDYTVTLTVTDNDGATASASAVKIVLNSPPVAIFTETAETVYTNEAITFNARDSYDPDGTIVSYFWDFGDETNGTGVTVDHAYTDDGSYFVTLTVTDDDGSTATAVALKTISNRSPIAVFTFKAKTEYSGEVIRFDASASFDPDGYITSYFWTFGDGTNATGMTVTHAYADDNSYLVNLTVTDNDGATASSTAIITVLNRPPVASFTESAIRVFAGEVIQFNASESYDPDGSIVSYTWVFGDGNTTTTFASMIDHTYTTPGTYNVTLTVTDDDGLTDDEVKTFIVEAAPWPLSLIVVIILLIVAATATAIYLVRKWRRKSKASVAVE